MVPSEALLPKQIRVSLGRLPTETIPMLLNWNRSKVETTAVMTRWRLFTCKRTVLLTFVLVFVGCSNSGNVPAAGRVLFVDKSPVRTGKVELRSANSSMRAVGVIDAEGAFVLKTDDGNEGIPPGEYEAVVVQFIVAEDMSKSMHGHGGAVPRRYSDYYTSGLKLAVPATGSRELQLIVEPN
jgi:hypothetical protein